MHSSDLKKLPEEELIKVLTNLSPQELEELQYTWEFWARPNQLAPEGDWRVWLLNCGRGYGKDIVYHTEIITENGFKQIGDIEIGDKVYAWDGSLTTVTDTYRPSPRQLIEFTFSDGEKLTTSVEHEWVTWQHRDRKAWNRSAYETGPLPKNWVNWKPKRMVGVQGLDKSVVDEALSLHESGMSIRKIGKELNVARSALTKHIKAGKFVARKPVERGDSGPSVKTTQEIVDTFTHGNRGDTNHSIPLAKPLEGKYNPKIVDPYYLGYWLGDGTSASYNTLACGEADEEELLSVWPSLVSKGRCVFRGPVEDFRWMDHFNLKNNKHFPEEILLSSFEQRLAVLRGLMDSDGHSTPNGHLEFCNTNKSLAVGVLELARTLGQKPVMIEGRATLYGKDCGPKYRVNWTPAQGINPFRLPRKAALVKFGGNQESRNHHRMIVAWEYVEYEPTVCISVDHPDRLFLAGRGLIPTHNTRTGAEWVREQVKLGFDRIAVVGPTKGSVRQVMVDGTSGILSVCHDGDKTKDGVHIGKPVWSPTNNTVTWYNKDNGKKVAVAEVFSAEDPERLRGPQFQRSWCDEICLISDSYIETKSGQKTIDKITTDDMVLTRFGYKPVLESWKTGERQTWKIKTQSGKTLQGTFDHPIMTPDGWKSLGELKVGENILVLNGMEDVGTKPSVTTSIEKVTSSTEKSMNLFTALFPKVSTSITSMKTKVTTGWKIWKHFLSLITSSNILLEDSTKTLTQGSGQGHSGIIKNLSSSFAKSVAHVLNQLAQEQSFARNYVHQDTIVETEKGDCQAVYNITVKDCHEYFANGVLNHNCAWTRRDETWDMLRFCMRLGTNPKIVVTTTPKPDKVIRSLVEPARLESGEVVLTLGSSYENEDNIDLTEIKAFEGTRLGRQEIHAEILTEAAGALWSKEILEKCEAYDIDDPIEFAKTLKRIVVSVDPATTSNKHSDDTGIVVAGVDINGVAYILEDATDKYTPEAWATKAIQLYDKYDADCLVAEKNQGGDLVRSTFKTVDETIPITLVHASKGKYARAEPVSALYEQGKVKHLRGLMELEDQMVTWEPLEAIGSPDRLDAMVWAIYTLLLKNRPKPKINILSQDTQSLTLF